MECKQCGTEITEKRIRCPNCGAELEYKKSIGKLFIEGFAYCICLIVMIFALLLFGAFLISDVDDTTTPKVTPTVTPIVTTEDIKNSASPISYDELMRNSDNYIGNIVYKRGEILQVNERQSNKYVLRVATQQSTYGYYEDIIWVEYKGNRLLEGDIIDIWGESEGLETYEALLGNHVTIPKMDSLHVELVTKAGNNR